MRRGNNPQRSRNNRPNGRKPQNLNRSLESNTPDGNKVRGNANQLYERYTGLAREAQSAGDRVTAEGFLQYAEHYYRVLSAAGWRRGQPNNGNGQQPLGPDGQPQQGMPNSAQQPMAPNHAQRSPGGEQELGDQDDEAFESGPPVN